MLQYFHRLSTSFAARLLFGILLFSFVVFGIGDVLRQHGSGNEVADIGDQHISADQLNEAFQQTIHGKIDSANAKKMGILDSVLNSMVDDALARLAARDDGLTVGRGQVLDIIEKSPAFLDDKTKTIDRERFKQFLNMYHLTEGEFIEYLQHQTVLKLMSEAQLGSVTPPRTLLNALYAFQQEQRRGEIIRIANASMSVPQPDADQVSDYYHRHEADYSAPEYRAFSVLLLSQADLMKTVTVTPEDIQQSYDARKAEFTVPERRELTQIVTDDQGKAEQVANAVKAGKSLADAAKAAGVDRPIDLGLMSRRDLPEPLQAPVFSAQPNATVPPIKTGFGWNVVLMKRIDPPHQIPFDQAKVAVQADLKAERARSQLADVSKKIDDQLAGGASLAEAGKPYNLTPIAVPPLDAKGVGQAGGALPPALKDRTDILKAVFAASKDTAAQIQDGADGSVFAIQVKDIIPPALRALDKVKADVVKGFTAEAQAKAASARAEELLKKAQAGTAFGALAREANAIIVPIGPISRDSKDKSAGPEIINALFSTGKPNDVVAASTPGGPVLVRLAEIIPVTKPDDGAMGTLTRAIEQQTQEDIASEYEQALRAKYAVKIHQDTLNALRATE